MCCTWVAWFYCVRHLKPRCGYRQGGGGTECLTQCGDLLTQLMLPVMQARPPSSCSLPRSPPTPTPKPLPRPCRCYMPLKQDTLLYSTKKTS